MTDLRQKEFSGITSMVRKADAGAPQMPNDSKEIKTNPDPTAAVKEAMTLGLANLEKQIMTLFAERDKAVVVARLALTEEIRTVKELVTQQFSSNEKLVDKLAAASKDLVDQLSKANSVALQAALSTQKESAAKSEGAIGELLKQLQLNYETANKAIIETLNRLTSRMDTGEAGIRVTGENKQERTVDRGQSFQQASVVIAAVAGVIALVALVATFVEK